MFSSAVGGGRWRGALRTSATQRPTRRSPRATPCSWWATTSVKQSPARAAIETSAACCGTVYTTRRTAAASELKWKPATPPDIAPSRRAPRSSRRRFCPRLKSASEPARASSSVRLRSARMVAAKPSSSPPLRRAPWAKSGFRSERRGRPLPSAPREARISLCLVRFAFGQSPLTTRLAGACCRQEAVAPIYRLSIDHGSRRPDGRPAQPSAIVAVGGAPKGKPTGGGAYPATDARKAERGGGAPGGRSRDIDGGI